MSYDELTQAARENVDHFLADLPLEALDNADVFYEEVYSLAHDGAMKAGARAEQASIIAGYLRTQY